MACCALPNKPGKKMHGEFPALVFFSRGKSEHSQRVQDKFVLMQSNSNMLPLDPAGG